MAKILILYGTTDGHTKHICERMASVLDNMGSQSTIINVTKLVEKEVDKLLNSYDKIVIGASIRYGKHSLIINKLIRAYQPQLDAKPNAFFSVNLVARKPEKSSPLTNPYLQKFLAKITWQPKKLAVFGGRLDYPSCLPFDRFMIRFIMWMTKGPTAPDTVIEYTNWDKVEEFAREVEQM